MSEFLKAFPSPELIYNVPAQLPSYLPSFYIVLSPNTQSDAQTLKLKYLLSESEFS